MYNNYPNPYSYQPAPQRQGNLDWIMVPTVGDIANVSVQPGSKAWVMAQNEPVFALRTADSMGLVNTDYYRFEKYSPAAERADYVTREQMEQAIAAALAAGKENV